MRKYNIVHLSTHDSGGASIAAYRTHQNLIAHGHRSVFVVQYRSMDDPNIVLVKPNLLNRIKAKASRVFREQANVESVGDFYFHNKAESESYFPTTDLINAIPFKPDLIMVHWVSRFVNTRNFFELSQQTGAPIFWYLLDAAPFTGGCHYFWSCKKFQSHCGECPALGTKQVKDEAFINYEYKKKFVDRTNIIPIAATTYYYELLKKSDLFAKKKSGLIPLGLDKNLFKPVDRIDCRSHMDLPLDKKIILLTSGDLRERRKGIVEALKSLDLLYSLSSEQQRELIVILLVGNSSKELVEQIKFNSIPVGFVNNVLDYVRAYQSSDLFLCSSLEDAGPLTAMESMLCGTPVVGFDVGVIPDIVIQGKTGFSTAVGDSENLAKAAYKIITQSDKDQDAMRQNCRNHTLSLFDPDIQVKKIIDLLENLKSGN